MTHRKQASVVTTIDQFLAQINALSQRTKSAEEPDTSHPSGDVDDKTQPATTGARAAENDRAVREANGPAASTEDKTLPDKPAAPDKGTGVEQSLTGEDPSVETESVETRIEDPGENAGDEGRGETDHPADLSNADINAKYSYAKKVLALIKAAEQPGNALVSRIAAEASEMLDSAIAAEKQAAALAMGAGVAQDNSDAALVEAGTQKVVEALALTVRDARRLAEKTAEYLNAYYAELRKQAEEAEENASEKKEDEQPRESRSSDDQGFSEEDAMADAAAMQPGGESPDDMALIEALLSAADEDENAQGGLGNEDLAAALAAGAGAGGEAAEEAVPGEAEDALANLSPEDAHILEQVLAQEGISPEELSAAATAKAAQAAIAKSTAAKGQHRKTRWQPKSAAEAAKFRAITKAVRDICRR